MGLAIVANIRKGVESRYGRYCSTLKLMSVLGILISLAVTVCVFQMGLMVCMNHWSFDSDLPPAADDAIAYQFFSTLFLLYAFVTVVVSRSALHVLVPTATATSEVDTDKVKEIINTTL